MRNGEKRTASLTSSDIKYLKYELRSGYLAGTMAWIVSISTLIISVYYSDIIGIYVAISIFLLGFLILYLINRRVIKDLNSGKKLIITKRVKRKEFKVDHEPGSSVGTRVSDRKENSMFYKSMNAFNSYSIIVGNERHRVDEDLWNSIEEGDYIDFHTAKYSECITLKEKRMIKDYEQHI